MADSIRIKRGVKADLPKALPLGELAYCTDTRQLFIGTGNSIAPVKAEEIHFDDLNERLEGNLQNINELDSRLSNVDNTRDMDKPISTATQKALDKKQNIEDYEKDKLDLNNKIDTLKASQSLEYEGENITCENTLTSRTSDVVVKGQTYQNVSHVTFDKASDFNRFESTINKFENGFLVANSDTPATFFGDAFTTPFKTIKPNTIYTIVLDVLENTLTKNYGLNSEAYGESIPQFTEKYEIPQGFVGRKIFTLTSATDVNTPIGLRSFYDRGCSGKIKYRYYILEGDWTNKEVPESITGIESVGEKENKISILSKNNKSADDINYKQDKKEILLPIEGGLKRLPKGVCDTIEQRDDGVYLVQKVGKIVLNGSENWSLIPNQISTETLYCQISLATNTVDAICDKIKILDKEYLWKNDVEGITPNGKGNLHFRINRSRLSTQDVNGLKTWLQANPTTVYYGLATPIETKLDINNLDLEVYKDTTHVTTDNAIQPTLSFKVPSNLGGVLEGNSQNINKLYKDVTELDSRVSNPNLFVNGDFQIWSNGTTLTNLKSGQQLADQIKALKQDNEDLQACILELASLIGGTK